MKSIHSRMVPAAVLILMSIGLASCGGGGAGSATQPGATVSIATDAATLNVTETGTNTFGVRLTGQPAASTTLAVNSSASVVATVSPSTLTFTAANWDVYQTVTVTGVDDADAVNGAATITVSGPGLNSVDVAATVIDNDVLGIGATPALIGLVEGASQVFQVKLTAQPVADVMVSMVFSSDPGAAIVSPTSFTFTPANWSTAQTLTVTGAQDVDTVDESVAITLSASGMNSVNVAATINDDDVLGISATPTSLSITEGASQTLQVRLTAQPAVSTTLAVNSSDSVVATVSPSALTFTTVNWDTYQDVTVTGVEDANAISENVTVLLTGTGLISVNVSATVNDNDVLDLDVNATSVTLAENASAQFQVRLTAQPAANVTVSVASSDPGAATVSPTSLTFSPVNWNIYQTVTVSGVADVDSNNELVTITISSPGMTSRTLTASVTDVGP